MAGSVFIPDANDNELPLALSSSEIWYNGPEQASQLAPYLTKLGLDEDQLAKVMSRVEAVNRWWTAPGTNES